MELVCEQWDALGKNVSTAIANGFVMDAAKKWLAIALFSLASCNWGVTTWFFKVSFYPTSSDFSWMLNCLQKLLLVYHKYISFLIIVTGKINPPHQAHLQGCSGLVFSQSCDIIYS